ncbi:hypothetical protein EJB05_34033 [Eragrostis curvula]|uniref:Diacylglycerol acyltransferase n=1 Tax=Eragrostis curvula TaxID=38414 RepID=A0A5J9U4E2_9POAL|nr:hypothetical protein EJB05_34033 [Eragrostis curvula]
MELTGAALRRSLPSASHAVARGRRRPARVACVRSGFAEEGHLKYYEAGAPRKAAVEAVAKDLAKLRAMGLVAGDAAKEKVLSEATDLLLQELNQMKDEEYNMKKVRKEEKDAMKALKKQQKEAKKAAAMMNCEDESSSESSESDCEDEQIMKVGQGMLVSTAASEDGVSCVSTVSAMECEKATMKAMKKMEKEQKKAAKKAMKMEKKAKKMAMSALNGCMDEDSSSESSESECEGEVVRMSRCATITAPQKPVPSTVFPIIVPQIPESVSPEPFSSEPATTTQCTSIAVVEKPMTNRIEVCMGGKCKKSGALALLQEFEQKVGTGGAAVGCKCLGQCGLGPNVRLWSKGSLEGSGKKNSLYIGVGIEDVDTIVAGLFGDSDLGMAPV